LIVKRIIKILSVALIIGGFVSGSVPLMSQSSSCCGTAGQCCCSAELENGESENPISGIVSRCGCTIEESQPPANLVLKAWEDTKPQYKIEIAEYLPLPGESLAILHPKTSIISETIRNSGPPIFIFLSSLLI